MLESAEIGHTISKRAYDRAEPRLREALLNAQFDLYSKQRGPVLLIISGVDGGGRSETANKLMAWMDPRHIRVHAFDAPEPEEAVRPPAWRFWRAMPPRGRLGIFMNAWYRDVLASGVDSKVDDDRMHSIAAGIRHHESMLTKEGVVLLKFWVHLAKADQKKRLEQLESDPDTSWRVTRDDWKRYRLYTRSHDVWEHVLRETSTDEAPWTIVEGTDERYRNLTVGRILLATMKASLAARTTATPRRTPAAMAAADVDNTKLIRDLDLSRKLGQDRYEREVEHYQGKIAKLTRSKRFADRSLVLVFEGVDAAGKGGAIRRVTAALDSRLYITVPVAAPTDDERAHPYLWRFWRYVPRRGGIVIFDRSWYGRVLVERVEQLCPPADWMRAYDEINQFEEQLVDAGAVVVKFWLQISRDEQLRRFHAREKTPFKRFKITADDWRNRKKWNAYEAAISDVIDRTSTEIAPWTLVEAEDKRYARAKVLKTIAKRLEASLE